MNFTQKGQNAHLWGQNASSEWQILSSIITYNDSNFICFISDITVVSQIQLHSWALFVW